MTSVYAPNPYPVEEEDKVDNFTTDDSEDKDDSPEASTTDESNHLTEEIKETDNKHTVAAAGDSRTPLPGSPLASNKTEKKKRKKKLKFSDIGNGDDSTQSSNSDSLDLDERNLNNSASVDEGEPVAPHRAQDPYDSHREAVSHSNSNADKGDSANDKYSKKEDKVLIELNGKFELVSVKELQAMGYPLPEEIAANESQGN